MIKHRNQKAFSRDYVSPECFCQKLSQTGNFCQSSGSRESLEDLQEEEWYKETF